MDDFEKELKQGFLDEASAAVEEAEQCFLQLEGQSDDPENIAKIFRLAHNLKGSSKAVGFDDMGEFTHSFENLLLKIKEGVLPVTPLIVNLLLKCLDHIKVMIEALRENLDARFDSAELMREIESAGNGDSAAPALQAEAPQIFEEPISSVPSADAFFEPVENIAPVLKAVPQEEIKTPKIVPVAPPKVDQTQDQKKKNANSDDTIRISTQRLEKLLNFVGEMVILQSVLNEQSFQFSSHALTRTVGQLGKVGKEIQDLSMGLRMLPIKQTFQKMQRIVRDTAQALDKEVLLTIIGDETEVDKTVLERIADPLVHLVRNSVDHGIESADRRLQNGKDRTGHVSLSARHAGGKLVIEVKDDGGGINAEKVFAKAVEKGIVKPNANLSEKEKVQLVFAPGFSTKEVVSEISGRGVGMDVVKTNIEKIGGEVSIETVIGQGSTFKIVLPLTLAIMECMVVRTGDEKYVLPSYHVAETLKIDESNSRMTAVGRVLLLRGENLPILNLSDLFKRKRTEEEAIGMIIRSGKVHFVMAVNDILGQYQIVTKPLAPELRNIKGVVGSTILGDGKPSMILEPNHFISSAESGREMRSAA